MAKLGLKVKEANFKGHLFVIFENYFMFLKIMRTRKTYLIFSFFFFVLKNTKNIKVGKY